MALPPIAEGHHVVPPATVRLLQVDHIGLGWQWQGQGMPGLTTCRAAAWNSGNQTTRRALVFWDGPCTPGILGWPLHHTPACHASRAGHSQWVKSIASTIQYKVQGLALAPAPIGTHWHPLALHQWLGEDDLFKS